MRSFCGSWLGSMSRETVLGISSSMVVLVEFMFCCCRRMWPLLVAIDLTRCFLTRVVVRPGHVAKWPFVMARRKVDGRGLKAVPW